MKNFTYRYIFLSLVSMAMAASASASAAAEDAPRPNVILIMTDDQGYGDLAAHGHPHLITPQQDQLRDLSVRLERFHVDPTCSPTRSALMTGRYSGRVGVWHTIMGRNMLREDEVTIAEVFKGAGYRTGIFGKWHLGDNYPYGARYRGFDDAVVHFAGGVGQTPDFWGNDYFEDHYNDNGVWREFDGYCTDVWFGEAMRFIRESGDDPFFLYLPLNAAHQTRPHVPERYLRLYKDAEVPADVKPFLGMITNIDDNLGVLLDRLKRWGLEDDTILIFMGDNGTAMRSTRWPRLTPAEWSERYNAGMRGSKSSHYDGGHRVFFFIRYPNGDIQGGRDVDRLTAHIDIMPTLMEFCGIEKPDGLEFDGTSLVPLLKGRDGEWPERTLFLHNQRVLDPIKWRNTSVMTDRWRLVDNRELFDIRRDPGQRNNIIREHPDVVQHLRTAYDRWWEDISTRFDETTPLYIGSREQPVVQLNAHDWLTPNAGNIPWNQPHVLARPESNGSWRIRVAREGRYRFILRERPEIARFSLSATRARLRIGEDIDMTQAVESRATGVEFEVRLPAGDTDLKTWLTDEDGTSRGAFFVETQYIDK